MFCPLSKFCGVFARHQRIQWRSTEGWDIIKQTQDLRAGVLMMLQLFCPRETFHHASFYHHRYGQQHSRLTWCYMSAWLSFRTKGMKKKKKKALCIFRSTESHWISWTRFLFSQYDSVLVSSNKTSTALTSTTFHGRLASGETWGTNGACVNLEFFDAFDDGFGSCGSFVSWPSWFRWKFRKGICLWLRETSGSPNSESGFEFYVETETCVSKSIPWVSYAVP